MARGRGAVRVSITGETAGLDRATRRAEQKIDRVGKVGRSAAGGLAKMGAAAGAAAAGLVSIAEAKKAIDVTTDLAKTTLSLNKNLGLGVKVSSEFAAVLKARGVDTKQVAQAFGTLAKNSDAARNGVEAQADAFARLGVTQKELKTLKPQQLINEVADGMKALGPGTERTALSMRLFGRGWQTVVPLLRGGSSELQKQLNLADKYGATFGGKTIKSMEQWIQAQRESKIAMMGLQVTFATNVVPALTAGMNAASRFTRQMRDGTGAGGAFAAKIKVGFDAARRVFTDFAGFVRRNRETLRTIAIGIGLAFKTGFGILGSVFKGLRQQFLGMRQYIKGWLSLVKGIVHGDFRQMWRGAKDIFKGGVNAVIGVMRSVTAPVRNVAKTITSTFTSGITKGLQTGLNAVIDLVNKVIWVVNKIPGHKKIGNIGHVGGGPKSTSPSKTHKEGVVPGAFKGAIVRSPTVMVGEEAPRHPEYVLATNPAYRARNVGLWQQAGHELGIPGFALGGIRHGVKSAGDAVAGGAKAVISGGASALTSLLPHPNIPGILRPVGPYVVGKAKDYIKSKVSDLLPDFGGGGSSSTGLVPQVKRAIAWARSHGWRGQVNSGFRSRAEQAILYARYLAGGNLAARPGTSEHEKGRAIDVSDYQGFLRAMASAPANARLKWFGPGDSVHFSISGHRRGGIIGRAAGRKKWPNNRVYSRSMMEKLWVAAGGPRSAAHKMASIAWSESRWRPWATNPSDGGKGLWQITPAQPGSGDAFTNAQQAVRKFREAKRIWGDPFHPWNASRSVWAQRDASPGAGKRSTVKPKGKPKITTSFEPVGGGFGAGVKDTYGGMVPFGMQPPGGGGGMVNTPIAPGEADDSAIADAMAEANRLAEERNRVMAEIAANQKQIIMLTTRQGPQLLAAVVAAVSGDIGGKIGLGSATPGFAGMGVGRL